MTWVSIDDEFQLLEAIQKCATSPDAWEMVLEQVGSALGGTPYLLEVGVDGELVGSFSEREPFAALATYLAQGKIESGVSPLSFLIHEAPLNYLFCKSRILTARGDDSTADERFVHFENQVGLLTPVWRPVRKTVIFGILFDSLPEPECQRAMVRATFLRLAKTISSTLSINASFETVRSINGLLNIQLETAHHCSALVDGDLRLISASPPFRQLLADGALFSLKEGILSVHDHGAENLLAKAVSGSLTKTAKGRNRKLDAANPQAVVIPDPTNGQQARVTITQLSQSDLYLSGTEPPLLRIEVKNQRPLSNEVMALLSSSHGLSQREAELAYLLATVGSTPEITEQLGITRNTVKTHLRKVFDKTGTQSQLELANLLHQMGQLFD